MIAMDTILEVDGQTLIVMDHSVKEFFRWLLIILFFGWGFLAILGNYAIVIRYYINGKQSSMIPFFGSIFCVISIALLPYPAIRFYWFVPFIVDFTWPLSFPWFLYLFVYRGWWKGEMSYENMNKGEPIDMTGKSDDGNEQDVE